MLWYIFLSKRQKFTSGMWKIVIVKLEIKYLAANVISEQFQFLRNCVGKSKG